MPAFRPASNTVIGVGMRGAKHDKALIGCSIQRGSLLCIWGRKYRSTTYLPLNQGGSYQLTLNTEHWSNMGRSSAPMGRCMKTGNIVVDKPPVLKAAEYQTFHLLHSSNRTGLERTSFPFHGSEMFAQRILGPQHRRTERFAFAINLTYMLILTSYIQTVLFCYSNVFRSLIS